MNIFFEKNHKKRCIWKTTSISAVKLGGKTRNSWEYPDSLYREKNFKFSEIFHT